MPRHTSSPTTNVSLTLDERDEIDHARHILKGCRVILRCFEEVELSDEDAIEGRGLVTDMLQDAVAAIERCFHQADARTSGARASARKGDK